MSRALSGLSLYGRWHGLRPVPRLRGYAASQVASVRDDPARRLELLRSLYEAPPGRPELHLPYRRAALAFMG